MKIIIGLMAIVSAFCLMSLLLLTSYQISAATSLRKCSSIEILQYSTNGSSELWNVASESMSPLLTPNDTVAVEKSVAFMDVQIGDIIVFGEPVPTEESGVVISRVNEILVDPQDQLVLVTKGDANSGSIPGIDFPIYEKDFIGVVDCFMEEGE